MLQPEGEEPPGHEPGDQRVKRPEPPRTRGPALDVRREKPDRAAHRPPPYHFGLEPSGGTTPDSRPRAPGHARPVPVDTPARLDESWAVTQATGRASACLLLVVCVLLPSGGAAQNNFEIQVYGSETLAPRSTMVELHTNSALEGTTHTENGVLPTNHAVHETLEITHGSTSWFETGVYLFASIQPDDGVMWVGNHIRPRVRAPESWELPVGLGLSAEIGISAARFRPIPRPSSSGRSSTSSWAPGICPSTRCWTAA